MIIRLAILFLLFAHCNAYLHLLTLRRLGLAAATSIVPIINHPTTPSPFRSWTRRHTISSPPCRPSHLSWCLFSSTVDSQGDNHPKLPSLHFNHNQTAFDYFSNEYFFEPARRLILFVNKEKEEKVLTMTLDEFFFKRHFRGRSKMEKGL